MKDKNAYDECKRKLDAYDRKVSAYLECLSREADDTRRERYRADECLGRLAHGLGCY